MICKKPRWQTTKTNRRSVEGDEPATQWRSYNVAPALEIRQRIFILRTCRVTLSCPHEFLALIWGRIMRQATAFIVLVVLVTGLACHGTPRRNMRPPDVQIYDYPPDTDEKTLQPPVYPKDEGLQPPAKNKDGLPKNVGQ